MPTRASAKRWTWISAIWERSPGKKRPSNKQAKGQRIISEELRRLGWQESELEKHAKCDPTKLALAVRLRREPTLTVR